MNRAQRQKFAEREERRVQRQEREGAAGRLLAAVPALATLDLSIHETRPDGCLGDNHYIRRIVVEHAPALFEIPCSYPDCEDGGYDLTREVLHALARGLPRFEGDRTCRGRCRAVDCTRVLRFVATATYRATPPQVEAPSISGDPFGRRPNLVG